jgi:hypothetical protein
MPTEPEAEPLLPTASPRSKSNPSLAAASRSKLAARRYLPLRTPSSAQTPLPLSEKSRGKQRALLDEFPVHETGFEDEVDRERVEGEIAGGEELGDGTSSGKGRGRAITIIFSNEDSGGGNLEVWVEEGESVGSVKDQVCSCWPSPRKNR